MSFILCRSVKADRVGSNFDRPPPGVSDWEHLALSDQNGFEIAIDNSFYAGMAIINGILHGWDCVFEEGIQTDNYVGDIFGSLGGDPDYGLCSHTGGEAIQPGGDMRAAKLPAIGEDDDTDVGDWGVRGGESSLDSGGNGDPKVSNGGDWPPGFGPPRQC